MKTKLLSIVVLVSSFASAQLYTPTGGVQTSSTNYIGIGTNAPQGSLDINANSSIPIIRGNGDYIPTGLRFIDDSYNQAGQVKEWSIWKGNTWAKGLGFMRYDAVNRCAGGICELSLFLADDGNIGINTSTPRERLEVNGNAKFSDFISSGSNSWIFHTPDDGRKSLHIVPRNTNNVDWDWGKSFVINGENGNALLNGKFEAKEVKIILTPTADFVFDENYDLPTLDEVEKHIKEKKHLPEIASAKEMEKEGVNVGEFQIKLLQKIEELTLYTIELNKQVKKQTEEIETLKKAARK
ncbi:hypothetical protein C1637_24250 [Chryseobacterium lactis]|uniref:Cell wall anchor protein n=1 Tax=Chryseobacterium lactis TaxID=1241981 RepID=A0A3G6RYZ1_CHRLC|nr:hypothetical protein [Chryseobacterium lactis]AZA82038.1 hypothetical protein EG342_09020 [Chryseobacterium lactis]AZB07036.1 hypothetical protein EG341_25135 [Chryseobacterium lactis]PNW11017.1 hypothetical protein C1637_24250 [Chryseobacterium lactis]